ncbi:pseudouridine synthase deg1 [Gnomoniopsis sp. IMI 355080]|nr:pseudouridine synthase deg1 [Gnomoniopsis sp. IMI 355080]
MADYNKWTKDDLIKRVKQLEDELKRDNQNSQPPTSPETTVLEPQNGDAEASLPGQATKKKQKKTKSMDPSKYATRFIALKLAYIGKKYNGFEYQCSGLMSTIEEELWKALVKACLIFPNPDKPNEVDWNVCEYSKCGRTDRGVSAFGQVVALRVRSNKPAKRKAASPEPTAGDEVTATGEISHGERKDVVMTEAGGQPQEESDDTPLPVEQEIPYCRVLNRILPPDIKVYAWCPNPPPDFSARFSCRERQYRYFFTQPAFAPLPNFLDNTNAATISSKPKDGWLDIDVMRQAAKLFEGLHDFRNFCKIDPSKQITNFQRRIYEADIVEVDGVDSAIPYLSGPEFREPTVAASNNAAFPKVYYFHVRGSAFLWHQIRCMVAVLFLVGQGLEKPSIVSELLDAVKNPRRPNYVLADDAPLVLWDCIFGRENEQGAADEVDWLYVGGKGDSPLNLHGSNGLAGDLWGYWREKKMDEILANRLLDWVSQKTAMQDIPEGFDEAEISGKMVKGSRVFEGGTGPKLSGAYVPVLKKDLMQSPESLNDRYAVRKGFKSAEEMRAVGNWREAIKEAKEKEATMDTAEG